MSIVTNLSGNKLNQNVNKRQSKNGQSRMKKSISISENIHIRLSDLGLMKQTPSRTEMTINNNRILSIFDEAIEKLRIAVNIKVLLQHKACRLRKCMPLAQVEYIQTICSKYLPRFPPPEVIRHKKYLQNVSTIIEKISKNKFMPSNPSDIVYNIELELTDMLDPKMCKAMELMCNNNNLKTRALTEWCITQDPISFMLINSMKKFRNVMQQRLSMTALEEKERQLSLRLAYITNINVLKKIQSTKKELEDQRRLFQSELDIKEVILNKYLNDTEITRETYKTKLKMITARSETHMYSSTHASDILQEELAELSKNTVAMYENILNQHLKDEKEMRKTRLKVETQLSSWLTKYDTDVGERQAIFDELTEGYEAEKAEYDILVEKFNEQDKEYVVLMAEKYEEEQRIWEERAMIFLRTRAARRIQRYWRAYRVRKIARRKAMKGKKKGKGEKKIKTPKRPQSKDKKGKKGKKDKKDAGKPVEFRGPDLNLTLGKKFGGDVFDDIQEGGFEKKDVEVDLLA